MPPHKIRQEWLALDETADPTAHSVTLQSADLIRHSFYFSTTAVSVCDVGVTAKRFMVRDNGMYGSRCSFLSNGYKLLKKSVLTKYKFYQVWNSI